MNFRSYSILLPLLLSVGSPSLPAQVRDTLASLSSAVQPDTAKTPTSSGVDTVVTYSARDSIIYSMRTRYMYLYGKTELTYQAIGLKAERTTVNWDTSILTAHGVVDSTDSTGAKKIGAPVLRDGGEEYNGSTVSYNFRTKKGKIKVADTEMDKGYYHGEEIKKTEPEVLYVADGRYTTCDAEHPHFYFASPKMKVLVRDKIVAEPIYFYVADVPLFALPFGVFPSRGGRTSGLITPAYGEDTRRGRYLSHFGYFWAVSDYWDIATAFDWYTRGGWLNRTNIRYNLRYNFTGGISANVTSLFTGEEADPGRTEQRDYNINITHNQQIDPTTRLDVNFSFMTGSYYQNFSNNLNDILQQNVVSNATLSKTWEGSNSNLSVNLYRDQNLKTGAINERLPSISFTQGQIFPFKKRTTSRGLSAESSPETPWYELISLSYSAQGLNNHSKQVQTFALRTVPARDSTVTDDQSHYGINHQIGINMAPKLGYFTFTPFMSYNEKWYASRTERDSLGTRDVSGFNAVRTYSLGLSTSTKFFGVFQPQVFGITGIRHTVTPSASFSFQPDFSDPSFGYYGTYIDKNQREVKYSFFEREVFGGAPSGKVRSLSFNVGNLFEMKYMPADTAAKEEKVQLLNLGASISYNLAADSLGLSPLQVSYRTELGRFLSVSASTTHDLYVFDETAGRRVNRFLLSETGKFADLTFVSLSLSTSLSGQKKQSQSGQSVPSSVQQEQDRASGTTNLATLPGPRRINQSIYDREEADFSIPWNISLSYTFSQSQSDPRSKYRSSAISAQLSFNLTDNWQIATGAYYDFVHKEFSAPSVNVTRDLHCWTMNFTWRPMGIARGFLFELRVKAPQLQDLKVTKQESGRGVYFQ